MPRQNGKNAVLELRELYGMVVLGERFLHSAHEVKTAAKAFKRLQWFFGEKAGDPAARFPELNALVKEVRRTNGQEAIVLKNGGSVEFVARTKGSGRGYSVDVLVIDEAQELTEDQLAAMLPTISASSNPQILYTGTPPGPASSGEVFTRLRSEALSGKSKRLAWLEWSIEPGSDLDDQAVWFEVNPALGIRLLLETVEDERAQMSDDTFARERLGMWSLSTTNNVVPERSWQEQLDESSVAVADFTLGVEVGPDLAWASICLAGTRPDGGTHVELVEDQHTKGAGVAWLVPTLRAWLAENPQIRCVMVDIGGPIAAMCEKRGSVWVLRGSDVRVVPIRVHDLGAACTEVLSRIVSGSLWHIGQPQLTAAVLSAGKRALSDTGKWVWSRRSAMSDITATQAMTYAVAGMRIPHPMRPTSTTSRGSRSSEGRRAVLL